MFVTRKCIYLRLAPEKDVFVPRARYPESKTDFLDELCKATLRRLHEGDDTAFAAPADDVEWKQLLLCVSIDKNRAQMIPRCSAVLRRPPPSTHLQHCTSRSLALMHCAVWLLAARLRRVGLPSSWRTSSTGTGQPSSLPRWLVVVAASAVANGAARLRHPHRRVLQSLSPPPPCGLQVQQANRLGGDLDRFG